MSVYIGDVPTFKHVSLDKPQAIKILEEASEVVDAFKAYYETRQTDWTEPDNVTDYQMARQHLLDECADVFQATCNLLSAVGVVDMTEQLARCKAKSERRGYEYADDRERITGSGKLSDSREQLEADYDLLLELERRIKTWRDYDGNFLRLYGSVAYAQIKELLEKQAAITEREVLCNSDERDEQIAELQASLDSTKRAIANAGGTWTQDDDGSVSVVFAPDVDRLTAGCDHFRKHVNHMMALIADIARKQPYTFDPEAPYETLDTIGDYLDELQGDVASLTAERDYWRDKCGKMLDTAHEITRLGDVE